MSTPIVFITSSLYIASVKNVFFGSQLPVRTNAGPTFAKVSGKSTITQTSGEPSVRSFASESNVAFSGFHRTLRPMSPPPLTHSLVTTFARAVPNASLRAPMLKVTVLPNFFCTAATITLPWKASDG